MTYSIIARCEKTGRLGVASTTSDVAVGARVPWIRAGVGAVVTQHRTDPRLGPRMLDLLATGADAEGAVNGAIASTPHAQWRQLAAIAPADEPYVWTGANVDANAVSVAVGADHAVVGNILANQGVAEAASAAFTASADKPFEERLLIALEAGDQAGGEVDELRSAVLTTVADQPFAYVDLRVDDSSNTLAELRRLLGLYLPAAGEYVSRALNPDAATGVAPSEVSE